MEANISEMIETNSELKDMLEQKAKEGFVSEGVPESASSVDISASNVEELKEIVPLEIEDLPDVSVLIPTFNRRKFFALFLFNITHLNYPPEKLEFVILDDSDKEPLFMNERELKFISEKTGLSIIYHKEEKKYETIGEKRNKLVELANHKHLCMMDDDDLYLHTYLHYSMSLLKQNKLGLVGCLQALFLYPEENDYKLSGIQSNNICDMWPGTLVFTKKHFNSMGGFNKTNNNECKKMIEHNENNVGISEAALCCINISHKGDIIDKSSFKEQKLDGGKLELSEEIKKMLDAIFNDTPLDEPQEEDEEEQVD